MARPITVSAPGSTMVTGEHAVVHGALSIVVAIEQRATVTLKHTNDATLSISSEIAPPMSTPIHDLVAEGPYRFVNACVMACRDRVSGGLDIDIQSDINHTLGLGSSAAVTVATLAALEGAATDDLHAKALKIIRAIQGRGSGADLAASLFGGALSYQVTGDGPAHIEPLPLPPQLSLFNVGYKTPTSEVLALVAAKRDDTPDAIDAIYGDMCEVATQTIELAKTGDWDATGRNLAAYHKLMGRLGVSDDGLEAAVAHALATQGVIGAKISGSGLGDCVLAMGKVPEGFTPVEVAQQGVVFHDNG